MPGTPVDLGKVSGASESSMTLSALNVPVGALIGVITSEGSTISGSVADSVGNGGSGYTKTLQSSFSGSFGTFWSVIATTALVGGTITYSFGSGVSAAQMRAFYVVGMALVSPVDITALQGFTSTANPTVTLGTPNYNDLLVGALAYSPGAGRTFTQASGWTTPSGEAFASADRTAYGYRFSNVAQTYNPTLDQASACLDMIVGFKPGRSGSYASVIF